MTVAGWTRVVASLGAVPRLGLRGWARERCGDPPPPSNSSSRWCASMLELFLSIFRTEIISFNFPNSVRKVEKIILARAMPTGPADNIRNSMSHRPLYSHQPQTTTLN